MRALVAASVIGVTLAATAPAYAEPDPPHAALDVCTSERAEAEAWPPAAEDVRAYQACLDRWRELLPRAEAELGKPPPPHLPACDGPFARWQEAAAVDAHNVDAMARRLAARDEDERCVRDVLTPREPLAVVAARIAAEHRRAELEHDRREGRGWIILGSTLLSVGGAAFTAVGGVGIDFMERGVLDDPLGTITMSFFGFISGGMAVTGAALLIAGAHKLARARRTLAP